MKSRNDRASGGFLSFGPDDVGDCLAEHQHDGEQHRQQGDQERRLPLYLRTACRPRLGTPGTLLVALGLACDRLVALGDRRAATSGTARTGRRHVRTSGSWGGPQVDAAGDRGRVDGHPLGREDREQRATDDHGRDRDDQPEGQRRAELGVHRRDRDQRAWMGRDQAVQRGQSGQGGDGDAHQLQSGALCHQHDDRQQQNQADLEEHRQSDDDRDKCHRPRDLGGRCLRQQGVDNPIRSTGVGEQLAQHGAECDQQANLLQDAAHALLEVGDDVAQPDAGNQSDEGGAKDERQKGVHLREHDQQHDEGDADDGRHHQPGVVSGPRLCCGGENQLVVHSATPSVRSTPPC